MVGIYKNPKPQKASKTQGKKKGARIADVAKNQTK